MIITTKSLVFLQNFLFLIVFVAYVCGDDSYYAGNCRESERMALLKFKAELVDDYDRLSSWGSITNCCEWKGVVCENQTNHVVALHLHGPKLAVGGYPFMFPQSLRPVAPLRGKISPSLLQLPLLQYLDLSFNDFFGTTIPNFIGSLTKLHHLSLSNSNFYGPIPHHLGNLSALRFLDLGGNQILSATNLDWLSGFRSVKYLDLTFAMLETCTTCLQAIYKLTALKELYLSYCYLPSVVEPISFPSLNSSTSLVVLDLSNNGFPDSSVLLRFLNMSTSLTYVDFCGNNLEGRRIPDALGNLVSLSHLRLCSCNLNDSNIPQVLGNLTSLSHLDISGNHLQGEFARLVTSIPNPSMMNYLSLAMNEMFGSFPNMSRFSVLNKLGLGYNQLSGELLEGNLRLPNLDYLDLYLNKFYGRLPRLSSCTPLLRGLDLFDNSFNGSLVESIENLSKIENLDASFNHLEGVITESLLSGLPHLRELDLSFNLNISVMISSSWIRDVQFHKLNLASCKLGPDFPKWLQKQNQLYSFDISNSGISDTIPGWFWGNIYQCEYLNMSHNQIYGVVPDLSSKFRELRRLDLSSNEFAGLLPPLPPVVRDINLSGNKFLGTILNVCSFKGMNQWLDLSNNLLSGEIPQDCFMNLLSLAYLNLANNKLSGEIPSSSNMACSVSSLHLRNNSFRGEIQRSLMNCSELNILDLGENEFIGKIPVWLGESMPNLGVLILKSNMLYGSLPSNLCHLARIQVLDVSGNKITGTIPSCMNNFTLLSSEADPDSWNEMPTGNYNGSSYDGASVTWKGKEATYNKHLRLLKMIDLSSNELFGEIPHELTSLIGLVGLNLSGNSLVGLIPQGIDQMRFLNFLDLSRNNLSGGIPSTLSKLSHLGVLDLSFNNLSGRIPWDTHMQTFGASTYLGNSRLCGPPLLSRPCPGDDQKATDGSSDDSENSEEKFINTGFYISLLLGFVVAFWVVFWSLYFNKWWNVRICITVADWLYVKVLVNKRRLMMRFVGNAS